MAIEDTGWKKPDMIQTPDGNTKGVIQPATGLEEKPCFTCASWEKNTRKLIQFFRASGLQTDAEGYFTTPIIQDFDDRTSMRVHPRDFGFCRQGCCPTHMNATCEFWKPTRNVSELALKVR